VAETTKATEVAVPTTSEGVRALLKRAADGDQTTVPTLRKLLEKPENVELLGGNLAKCAQRSFVEAIAGKDLSVREAVAAKLDALRKELLGDNPTPVERLLVERVAACWLQVQDADIRAAHAKEATIRQADFHQRRMDAAHKRYLSALKALALVRKLAVPALQINLARKQVNVVAPLVPG
jgi:hypothetical protein